MNTDELVDKILVVLPELVHQIKGRAAEICLALSESNAHDSVLKDISVAQLRAIILLYKRDRMPVGEVAEGIGITIATASQLIDRLVVEGWAARSENPEDRRQVLISLTPRARQTAGRIHHIRRAQIRSALESMEPETAEQALNVLQAIVTALSAPINCPPDESQGRGGY